MELRGATVNALNGAINVQNKVEYVLEARNRSGGDNRRNSCLYRKCIWSVTYDQFCEQTFSYEGVTDVIAHFQLSSFCSKYLNPCVVSTPILRFV